MAKGRMKKWGVLVLQQTIVDIFFWLHLVIWCHTDTKSFLITSLPFHKGTFNVMAF